MTEKHTFRDNAHNVFIILLRALNNEQKLVLNEKLCNYLLNDDEMQMNAFKSPSTLQVFVSTYLAIIIYYITVQFSHEISKSINFKVDATVCAFIYCFNMLSSFH